MCWFLKPGETVKPSLGWPQVDLHLVQHPCHHSSCGAHSSFSWAGETDSRHTSPGCVKLLNCNFACLGRLVQRYTTVDNDGRPFDTFDNSETFNSQVSQRFQEISRQCCLSMGLPFGQCPHTNCSITTTLPKAPEWCEHWTTKRGNFFCPEKSYLTMWC